MIDMAGRMVTKVMIDERLSMIPRAVSKEVEQYFMSLVPQAKSCIPQVALEIISNGKKKSIDKYVKALIELGKTGANVFDALKDKTIARMFVERPEDFVGLAKDIGRNAGTAFCSLGNERIRAFFAQNRQEFIYRIKWLSENLPIKILPNYMADLAHSRYGADLFIKEWDFFSKAAKKDGKVMLEFVKGGLRIATIKRIYEMTEQFRYISISAAKEIVKKYAENFDEVKFMAWFENVMLPILRASPAMNANYGNVSSIYNVPYLFDGIRPNFGPETYFLGRETTAKKMIIAAAKRTGLPIELLAAALLQEGYLRAFTNPRISALRQWRGINSFIMGMDYFLKTYRKGLLGSFLPKGFKEGNEFVPAFSASNGAEMVMAVKFRDEEAAINAFAALLRYHYGKALQLAKRHNVKDRHSIAALVYMNYNFGGKRLNELIGDFGIEHLLGRCRDGSGDFYNVGRVVATVKSFEQSRTFG